MGTKNINYLTSKIKWNNTCENIQQKGLKILTQVANKHTLLKILKNREPMSYSTKKITKTLC